MENSDEKVARPHSLLPSYFGVGIMGDLVVVFSRLFLKVKYVVFSNYLTNVTWFRYYRLFRNLFEVSAIKGKAIVS
jgi:hypothetical protein